jgi:hypothetical protein
MARYIDADRMQDFLVETNDVDDWCVSQYNADWISSFIENQPTADVAKVVRCKDCKHFMEYSDEYHGKVESADGDCYLRFINSVDKQFQAVCCNDFCSYGKRKEDE